MTGTAIDSEGNQVSIGEATGSLSKHINALRFYIELGGFTEVNISVTIESD